MEKIDLYDRNRQLLNQTAFRGEKLPNGTYRLVIHICLFNDKDEMLIQQRQTTQKHFANLWDLSVGGQVRAGETSWQGVQRELLEELGINMDMSDILPKLTVPFKDGFDDVYLVRTNVSLDELTLQKEEVQAVKWANEAEILDMIGCGEFIGYQESYIHFLFSMIDGDGTFD